MPDSPTAQKIASHKFGRRKLTSLSALAALNKLDIDPANSAIIAQFHADSVLTGLIGTLNTHLNAFFAAYNLQQAAGTNQTVIELGPPGQLSIPQNVWLGRIKFPVLAGVTAAQDAAAAAARKAFADAAGKFRARIATIYAANAVINDLGNDAAHPNAGGVVVGVKHTPANQG